MRSRAREYVDAFGEDAQVYYASKAFCSRAVLRWVTEEGLGVDVCTGGELAVALSAGVDPALITLHGNNKLPAEIEQAVAARRRAHRGRLLRGDRPARLPARRRPGCGRASWSG